MKSLDKLKELHAELKREHQESQEAADSALADAAQVSSVIRVLEKGDLQRLKTVIGSLDTAVREVVLPCLTKKEQKASGWETV